MGRHAPVITAWSASKDNLRVVWKVDDFYEDSESPDLINVVVNGFTYDKGMNLTPDTREISIPISNLAAFGVSIIVEIQFVWRDVETLVSSVSMTIGANESQDQANRGAAPAPSLSIKDIRSKTLHDNNRMTLTYSSENWNKGTIRWGVRGFSKTTVKIKPEGGIEAKYSGHFTTDLPLAPHLPYEFEVSVTNGFESKTGTSVISAISAPNFRSVRAFLWASGIPRPTSLRQAGLSGSVRYSMGI